MVIDNDPAASACDAVAALAAESPFPLVYVHEPRPGVATARNAGLKATDAALIAFLDDDEEAPPHWLSALLETRERFDADAVFSPIQGRAPDEITLWRPYFDAFFSRTGPAVSQTLDHGYGCGASLLKRATALPGSAPFDTGHDQIGGEDDALFAALEARGGRFAWAAEAVVTEHAPAHRATLAYALKRAFAYGQGPSQTARRARDWKALARWMAIGAAQAAAFGLIALPALLLGRPEPLDRAVRGLGKLVWMEGFEPRVYGQAEISRLAVS